MQPPLPTLSRAPFAEVTIGANQVAVLKDGAQAYPAMLEAIAKARSTVCLQTYILRDDATGKRFAGALIEKASAGVEVSVLYDGWGSTLSEEFLQSLRHGGVKLLCFGPLRFTGRLGKFLGRLRKRNHRKALIVDGEVAFTGGLNIADDYAAVEDGGSGWRDTHVRVRGPAAVALERRFLDTWHRHGGERLDQPRYQRQPAAMDPRVRFIENEFRADRKDIRNAYVGALKQAKRRVQLTHAYFLPPSKVLRAIVSTARRGVKVKVIIAGATDVPILLYGARALYDNLLKAGVQLYEWQGRVLHAKTAVIDGKWVTVGSANLDHLSLRRNLEVNAVFDDASLGSAAETLFEQDLTECKEITLEDLRRRPWWHRVLSRLAYALRTWL